MNFRRRNTEWRGGLLPALAALLGMFCVNTGTAVAGTLPAATGTLSGTTRTFDLWAKPGLALLPGGVSVSIWGYTDTAADAVTHPGGPALIVNQGETVVVNLNNMLPEATSLLFQGQTMVPDTAGASPLAGTTPGTKNYTFVASSPGTFLYEAGLRPNAQHQTAMGLYGALIVRPTSDGTATGAPILTQAYSDAASSFVDEALVVLGEMDPALNNSANPAAFDMRDYAPKYFLINGKAYPDTDAIDSAAANLLLLRYINAGIMHHSMGLLGLRQNFVAKDGGILPALTHNVAAESFAPGQTGDSIIAVPAATTDASRFAVYDASLMLHNNGAPGFGGMLTFINVASGNTANAGPVVSALSLSTNQTTLTATMTAGTNKTVTAWEYWIDSGTHNSSTVTSPSATVTVTATIPAQPSGSHTVYARGQDDAGNWGAPRSVPLVVDTAGPLTTGLTLSPNPSNGTVSVALHATGNDSTTGGSNVVAAEYFVGSAGADGTGTPIAVNVAAPIVSLDATIPPPVSAGTVFVHGRDALGNWGPVATIQLQVVSSGPAVNGVTARPAATNGIQGLSASQPVVRITATFTSAGSTVSAGEGFIDTLGTTFGSGFPFVPSDGVFNSASESGFADIPLTTLNVLAAGNHTIFVRGRDAAGNWGSAGTGVVLIDRTAPTFTGISLAPSPTFGAVSVTLTVNGAVDPQVAGLASGVSGGEYWMDAAVPAPGGGTPFAGSAAAIPVSALSTGNHAVGARIRDAAGNWGSGTASATVFVVPDLIFSNGFESGSAPWGWTSRSTNTTSRLNVTATAALIDTRGLQAQGNNTNYVQENFVTAANPAWPTYDARFYFRPNANTSSGKDIFVGAGGTTFSNAQTLFRVRYRLNGTTPQVQLQAGSTNTNTAWTNILAGTANNFIEVVWQAVGSGGANPGTLRLYVNGVLSQTLTTTSTASVAAVRLGSVTGTGNATLMYFDAFASKRTVSPLLGP